tara:strand:+ start:1086 stop:2669 length:1584 start_codon:yes stop_codon:yes gene_type:complete
MTNYKIIILSILFFLYFIIGAYLSLTTGISHDQYHEQLNWKINFEAIQSIFFDKGSYEVLLNYLDKYHGIAFHYISQPVQFLIYEKVANFYDVTLDGSYYLSRHLAVFIFFCFAGYFFYLLSYKISNDKNFSIICLVLLFLYPYLFGHAQINGKDIPFMSVWIISTFLLFKIIESFYYEEEIGFINILLISLVTAFLISIRVTGILILLEYFIALIILLNVKNIKFFSFLNKNKNFFILFPIFLLFFIYIFNPILWLNPLELINSIKWMGKYYHDVCTLTLGNCMKALNLPSSYIFIWLFFKLPIIILLGLAAFPLIEKKIFNDGLKTIFYGIISITTLTILFLLILRNVALYDEIRHIMFLIPLIFLIGLYNIFIFNKNLFYVTSILVMIFFIFENISLKKYQYTWLNSLAKFTDIKKNFEIDYMGISNKNLQLKIYEYSIKNDIPRDTCVYGNSYSDVFLSNKGFTCFKLYSSLDSAKNKPFFAYQNGRNIKRSNPKDCKLIHSENYRYTLSKKDIVSGKLWFCK